MRCKTSTRGPKSPTDLAQAGCTAATARCLVPGDSMQSPQHTMSLSNSTACRHGSAMATRPTGKAPCPRGYNMQVSAGCLGCAHEANSTAKHSAGHEGGTLARCTGGNCGGGEGDGDGAPGGEASPVPYEAPRSSSALPALLTRLDPPPSAASARCCCVASRTSCRLQQ